MRNTTLNCISQPANGVRPFRRRPISARVCLGAMAAAVSHNWASQGAGLGARNGAPADAAPALDARALQAMLVERLKAIRPWATDFFAVDQFSLPGGMPDVQARLLGNSVRYQTNYAVVAAGCLVITLLMHFFMAVVLALLGGAAYAVSTLPADYAVAAGGLVFTRRIFLYGIGLFAVLLLLATDVGTAFFWVLGIAGLGIAAHAVMHAPPDAELPFEQP